MLVFGEIPIAMEGRDERSKEQGRNKGGALISWGKKGYHYSNHNTIIMNREPKSQNLKKLKNIEAKVYCKKSCSTITGTQGTLLL